MVVNNIEDKPLVGSLGRDCRGWSWESLSRNQRCGTELLSYALSALLRNPRIHLTQHGTCLKVVTSFESFHNELRIGPYCLACERHRAMPWFKSVTHWSQHLSLKLNLTLQHSDQKKTFYPFSSGCATGHSIQWAAIPSCWFKRSGMRTPQHASAQHTELES